MLEQIEAAGSLKADRPRLLTWLVVVGVVWMSHDAIAGVQPIAWRTGAAELSPQSASQRRATLQSLVDGRSTGGRHILVQLSSPVDDALRSTLAARGMRLLSYVGGSAFFASLAVEDVDVSALSQIGEIAVVEEIRPAWKLHPMFNDRVTPTWAVVGEEIDGVSRVGAYVLFHRDVDLAAVGIPLVESHGAAVRDVLESVNGLVIELPMDMIPILAQQDAVQWVEPPLPRMSGTNNSNRVRVQANELQMFFGLNGHGVTVLVYDAGTARASHVDFGDRMSVLDSDSLSAHATHVAGTIGGSGTSNSSYRGMASSAILLSYGFEYDGGGTFLYSNPGDMENDYADAINVHGADLSNNSIGTNTATNGFPCEITGDYGVTAQLIDTIVRGGVSGGEPFRVVWANGNERQTDRCGDMYRTTAPPACAKNHITVGALNSNDDSMTTFSSWGPTDDGRMKPDISAPGCQSDDDMGVTSCSSLTISAYTTMCGTSMAAPTVTGCAALLLEDYRDHYPAAPDPLNSTIKVLLAHRAVDLGNPGPDFQFGYGSVRAKWSVLTLRTGNLVESELGQGQVRTFYVVVDPGETALKATMAWDDFPASPNVGTTLVNDLDIRAFDPSGTIHHPWVLDPSQPSAPAVRTGPNRRDNIEQVFVEDPVPGVWRIDIEGYNVPEGPQAFSLVASPNLAAMHTSFPDGLPQSFTPGVPTTLAVMIEPFNQTLVPGSPTLHFRYDGGSWASTTMTNISGALHEAELPPAVCGAQPEFHVSAAGSVTGVVTWPAAAPGEVLTAAVEELIPLFSDDFETHQGWLVENGDGLTDGAWERAIPAGGGDLGDPAADYDGTGFCYVTDNADGDSDVDDGYTRLISPAIDLSGSGDHYRVSYARWYTNHMGGEPNADVFETSVSNDDGTTWMLAEQVGPATAGGWTVASFNVADFVTPTSTIRVRFEASDVAGDSIVEAGIDAFGVSRVGCFQVLEDCNGNGILDADDIASGRSLDVDENGVPDECEQQFVLGDLDCDGDVDFDDINPFVLALSGEAAYLAEYPACQWLNADCDEDGDVDSDDINAFVSLLGG